MENIQKVYVNKTAFMKILANNNLTQKDLSEILNIDNSSLNKMINAKIPLSNKYKIAICDLFQIEESKFTKLSTTPNKRLIYNRKKSIKSINKKIYINNIPCNWNQSYFKEMLKKKNITKNSLGRYIGISGRAFEKYPNYVKGHNNPTLNTLYKTCAVLECSVKELMGVNPEAFNSLIGIELFDKNGYTNYINMAGFTIPNLTAIKQTANTICTKQTESTTSTTNTTLTENTESAENVNNSDDSVNATSNNFNKNNKAKYKHFEDENVIKNINTINENILLLVEDLQKSNQVLFRKIEDLTTINVTLAEKINHLEDKLNLISHKSNSGNVKYFKPINPSASINYTCTEKELNEIVKTSVTNDILKDFKIKIYKLATYIGKKINGTLNEVLYSNYKQFSKTYGLDLTNLKKESNNYNTLESIYENPLYREIFFNMLCTNATNC